MAKKRKYNSANTDIKKKQFLEAFKKSLGIISTACDTVDINRDTYYEWLKKDKEFASKTKSIKERATDFVESCLYKQIKEGSTAATIFYLKTKGRKRGYTEKDKGDDSDKTLFNQLPMAKRLAMIKLLSEE